MQAAKRIQTCQNIVKHNTETTVKIFVCLPDGPGFDDIEEPEKQKTGQQPVPGEWHQGHGDKKADDFIPDNATVVVDSHVFGRFAAKINAQHGGRHQYSCIVRSGQLNE